jgi:hypothetical protein
MHVSQGILALPCLLAHVTIAAMRALLTDNITRRCADLREPLAAA